MRGPSLPLLLPLLLALARPSGARLERGHVSSEQGFAFLGKFCFDYTRGPAPLAAGEAAGLLDLTLWPDEGRSDDLAVLVYDDEPDSWARIYAGGGRLRVTCAEAVAAAKNADERSRVGPLYRPAWSGTEGEEAEPWRMPATPIRERQRPRFWYVAVANCRTGGFRHLGFALSFLNGGGFSARQFGYDQQGLTGAWASFAALAAVLLALHAGGAALAWRRGDGPLHPLPRLFAVSLALLAAGSAAVSAHFFSFATDGEGLPAARAAGEAAVEAARVAFVALLLLVASGWTVSTPRVRNRGALTAAVACMLLLYAALVAWYALVRDPASTVYAYESVPGAAACVLDGAVACWFVSAASRSLRDESKQDKRWFYAALRVAFGAWLALRPLLVLATALAAPPWMRERTVVPVSLAATGGAFAGMVYLLRHSSADKYLRVTGPEPAALMHDDGL